MRDTAMTDENKANRKTVIRLLNEALATEVICILRYKRHYFYDCRDQCSSREGEVSPACD